MKTKETILKECTGHAHGLIDVSTYQAMQIYADQQQRAALTKFKADAIYCNGTGINDMNIEDYLNVEVR